MKEKMYKRLVFLLVFVLLFASGCGVDWEDVKDKYSDLLEENISCSYYFQSVDNQQSITGIEQITLEADMKGIYARYNGGGRNAIVGDDEDAFHIHDVNGYQIAYNNFANSFETFLDEYDQYGCQDVIYLWMQDGYFYVDMYCPYDICESFGLTRNSNNGNGNNSSGGNNNGSGGNASDCVNVDATVCKKYTKDEEYSFETFYFEFGWEQLRDGSVAPYFALSEDASYDDYNIAHDRDGFILDYKYDTVLIDDEDKQLFFPTQNALPDSNDIQISAIPMGVNTYYYIQHRDSDTWGDYEGGNVSSETEDEEARQDAEDLGIGNVEGMVFCDQDNVRNAFQIIGYLLFAAKVAVPLLLIILGVMDFSKAVISDDDKSVKEASFMFAKRVIIAAIIFLIPTILNFLFSLVDGAADLGGKFEGCTNCLFEPLDASGCEYKTLKEQAED